MGQHLTSNTVGWSQPSSIEGKISTFFCIKLPQSSGKRKKKGRAGEVQTPQELVSQKTFLLQFKTAAT
jgi:hypothetical protein